MWQTTPIANNAGRAAAHNVIQKSPGPKNLQNLSFQILVILSFYFSSLLLEKPDHEETIVYGSSWKAVDDRELKVFLGVVILIGVYKFNNESVAWLWSTLNDHF